MDLNKVFTCGKCRRMFQYPGYGPKLCPECKKQDDEDYEKVKTYLRDNPGRTLYQTSEDCNVSIEEIRGWLKDERLEYKGEGSTGLVCEHCGAPITSGKLCDECRMAYSRAAGEMARSLSRPTEEKKKPVHNGDRMRFLGGRRK